MKNPFAVKDKTTYSNPEGQSKGILDDYSVRKSAQTIEFSAQRALTSGAVINLNADMTDGQHLGIADSPTFAGLLVDGILTSGDIYRRITNDLSMDMVNRALVGNDGTTRTLYWGNQILSGDWKFAGNLDFQHTGGITGLDYLQLVGGTEQLTNTGGTLFWDGFKIWNEYNDGTGSGLDADKLDGCHSGAFAPAFSSGTLSASSPLVISAPVKVIDGSATLTIKDAKADGAQKGAACFNSTNFSGTGEINTIQDIATTSSPTFASMGIGAAPYGTDRVTFPDTSWGSVAVSYAGTGYGFSNSDPLITLQAGRKFQIGQIYTTPFFTATGGGNVGIGTTTPSTKLEVNGTISGAQIYSTGGFTGTITTASLVGKTITISGGIIIGFA